MTYGELKDYVLQLLNTYSVAGSRVAESYNDQADLILRIPALTRDALYYLTTTVCRQRAAAELTNPQSMGDFRLYDLPDDCYQLCGGPLLVDETGPKAVRGYQILAGRQLLLTQPEAGTYLVEYFRYPAVPVGTPEDDAVLDCPPQAHSAVACYVAAHLAMEDNNYLYGALYNEFERKLLRLREGEYVQWGVTEDAYGAA